MQRSKARNGDNQTDTLNRAILLYDMVTEMLEPAGARLMIKGPDGVVTELRII